MVRGPKSPDLEDTVSSDESVNAAVENELETFVPPEYVELSSGKKVKFPKLSWRIEKHVMKEFGSLIQKIPSLRSTNFANFTVNDLWSLVGEACIVAPESVETILYTAYGLQAKDIDDLDLEDIGSLLVPLCVGIYDNANQAWNKVQQHIPAAQETPTQ